MDCNETRRLLDADVDGEIDLVRHLEIERHIATCAECARRVAAARDRKAAIRNALPSYKASSHLMLKVQDSLRHEPDVSSEPMHAPNAATASPTPPAKRVGTILPFPSMLRQLGGMAAAVLLAVGVGYSWGVARAQRNQLITAAIADHIRSLQPNHLLDVVSTDQHTVKPWFAGRVEFSPPVVDLAAKGFPLVGGRLEHLDAHTVAALVYHRRKHVINLFVWPADRGSLSLPPSEQDGYHVLAWSKGDLNFLAVSEIPAPELQEFVAEFRASVSEP